MATYGNGNGNGNNGQDNGHGNNGQDNGFGTGNNAGGGNGNGNNGQNNGNGNNGQDNGNGSQGQHTDAGTDIDGYLAGAKVFVDSNYNGVFDSGEASTFTDAQGNFSLSTNSQGQLVSIGGTDTLTGLSFNGTLTAPAGSSVITPLTTLVNQVAQQNGGDVSAAQASVASALGIQSGLNLDSFDPIAATKAGVPGASTALAASASLVNTAKLIAATGASGSFFSAVAAQIAHGGGRIDLTNPATISALAVAAGAGSSAATAVGQVAAASNAAVAAAVQADAGNPAALVSAVEAASRTAQGTTASALAAAGNDSSKLAQVVVANTGSSLSTEISSQAGGSLSPGSGNNNSIDAAQSLQDFLASVFNNVGTVPVTYIGDTGSGTFALLDSVGVVAPGSNANIHMSTDAALLVSGGATVNLSSSPLLNPAGLHLGASVQLGDGSNTLTLNRGPSFAQSSTGNDTLISSGGHDTLSGGFGQDSMLGGGHSLLLGGQTGHDTLQGGLFASSHDTIEAGVGGDLIRTSFGHNLIDGNANDTIFAGSAQDMIGAGSGAETIHGGLGSTIYSNGLSTMDHGFNDTYNVTGADTIYGSSHANTVNIQDGSNGVLVDGTTGSGALHVNVTASNHGNDTLFGGTKADGTGSDLTVHVAHNFTVSDHLDKNGFNVVHVAGGQTLHVANVTIDFNGTKTSV